MAGCASGSASLSSNVAGSAASHSLGGGLDLRREEEFFGFHPARFIDDVANCAVDYAADCIDDIENVLAQDRQIQKIRGSRQLVSKGCDESYGQFKAALDKNLDKFELYVLRNVFKVPDNLDLLPSVSAPCQHTAEEAVDAEVELQDLNRKLLAAQYFREEMKREARDLDAQIAQIQQYREQFNEIDEALRAHGVSSMPESMAALQSQSQQASKQIQEFKRLSIALQDKENHTDPEARLGVEYRRARTALGSATTNNIGAVCSLLQGV